MSAERLSVVRLVSTIQRLALTETALRGMYYHLRKASVLW